MLTKGYGYAEEFIDDMICMFGDKARFAMLDYIAVEKTNGHFSCFNVRVSQWDEALLAIQIQ